jgi:hypothetical protein
MTILWYTIIQIIEVMETSSTTIANGGKESIYKLRSWHL